MTNFNSITVTEDGKQWVYDTEHHEWINVSVDNPKLRKLVDSSVRVR